MQQYLTNAQMREAEKSSEDFGIPSEVLMKRAGRALADEVQEAAARLGVKDVLFVCGTGNNGGDGYVAARELLSRGLEVSVFSFFGELSAGCRREKKRFTGKTVRSVSGRLIVDCIFGTGLNRKLQGEFASVVKKINSGGAYVISADIPSGINGDNGLVMGAAVKADLTVAFGYPKIGCVIGDGIDYSGKLTVKDIGIAAAEGCAYAPGEQDISGFFKERLRNTNKGDYGKACIVAGSERFPGAAVLAVSAALRSGCGYVSAVVPEKLKYALAVGYPQCIYGDSPALDSEALAVGMGLGCSTETYERVCALLKSYKGKLIIDADGLNSLAQYGLDPLKNTRAKVLITPHIGEMCRLCALSKEEVLADPVGIAQKFAAEYNVTVHLKSSVSATCDGKRAALSLNGTSSLARAGSGDMLSGLICGTAARGLSLFDAAVCSRYVLGASAEKCSEECGDYCVTADDIIKNICCAVKRLTAAK